MKEAALSNRAARLRPSAIRAMTRLAAAAGPELITFAGGMPNPKTFPLQQIAAIASEQILNHAGKNLQYGMTAGYRPLISWITTYMDSKGLTAAADNIICTTGSQQAIDLVTEVVIDPDDFVLVEKPTYIGALASFRKSGATILGVQQDDDGIVPDDLETRLRQIPNNRKRLLYLISNFQNPSGVSLEAERRHAIARLLEKYNVYLIEDDPYGEIYFTEDNKPPHPIHRLLPDRVFYMSTFSKLVAPTFRTGWVAAPQAFARKIELAKEAADLCTSLLDQRIVHAFCSSADFLPHLQSLRNFYSERYGAMEVALQKYMPSEVSWTKPSGGFFIWMKLPLGLDSESFLEECISTQKVSFVIGRAFTHDDSATNYLRLAFSVEEPQRIDEGIRRLCDVIRNRLYEQ